MDTPKPPGSNPISDPSRIFTPPTAGELVTCEGRPYWLGPFLGNGYFGAVYECTDAWGDRLVAKILLPRDRPYEEVRQQWLRELSNLRELRHPNITFVHDAFEYRDTFYLILERCDSTLLDLIQWRACQPEVWLMPIAKCLLQGLDFIHRAGYVHKDIHPGNIHRATTTGVMSAPTPATVFKIGDLGISRLAPEIDVFNTILAKWMLPPEALQPWEFGPVDQQLDIYHSGLTLLSLLLKSVPSFDEAEILAGKPRELAEHLNSRFGPPIARALRRHSRSRTPTPLAFWDDLRSAAGC